MQFLKHAAGAFAITIVGLIIVNKVSALSSVRTLIGLSG